MKKILTLIALVSAFVLNSNAANFTTLMNGYAYTNANVPLFSATNSSGVWSNNFQIGTAPGASNILFALSANSGTQPYSGATGLLPAFSYNTEIGYPNTLYGPQNYTTIVINGFLMATNATSTAVLFKFASSIDGGTSTNTLGTSTPQAIWVTNYTVLTMTIPVNSFNATQPVTNTIATGGWGYLNLQAIENPGVAALTNIVIEINGKPGL